MKTRILLSLLAAGMFSGCGAMVAKAPAGGKVATAQGPHGGSVVSATTPAGRTVAAARPAAAAAKLPPPEFEIKPPRPKIGEWMWVYGHLVWSASAHEYVWKSGHWERLRPGRKWVLGHYMVKDGIHVWVPGRWK